VSHRPATGEDANRLDLPQCRQPVATVEGVTHGLIREVCLQWLGEHAPRLHELELWVEVHIVSSTLMTGLALARRMYLARVD
jgi:hypothetical protein